MPKCRLQAKPTQPVDKLKILFAGWQAERNITSKQIATATGITAESVRRKKSVGFLQNMTYLYKWAAVLEIPPEELSNAVEQQYRDFYKK